LAICVGKAMTQMPAPGIWVALNDTNLGHAM